MAAFLWHCRVVYVGSLFKPAGGVCKTKMYKPIVGLHSNLVFIKCKEQKDGSKMVRRYV